jgi:pimeloyl-ACP methyl ester carboxylesterase
MSSSIENFRVELPHGITLTGHAAGPKDAPVLVFLHGFPEAAFAWDDLLAHFGQRFRCVAPNLRGYADSSSPTEVAAYRAKPLLADLAALIELLGAPLEALVAHDWGGAIGWALGIQRPELARRLVLINTPHPGAFLRDLQSDPAQQAASAYMTFLRRPDAEALLAENDFARLWPFFTRMGGDTWLTDALREQYRAVWRQGLTGALNWYRASPMAPPTKADDPLLSLRLTPEQLTVQVPTTLIWGEGDTALLPSLVTGLDAWVPQLHLVRVPEATHWIVHEQPARVIQEIEAALAR